MEPLYSTKKTGNYMEPLYPRPTTPAGAGKKLHRCSFKLPVTDKAQKPHRCPTETEFVCQCGRVACNEHRERFANADVLCVACARKRKPGPRRTTATPRKSATTRSQTAQIAPPPLPRHYERVPHADPGVREAQRPVQDINRPDAQEQHRPNFIQRWHYRRQGWLASGHGDCPQCGKTSVDLFRRWHFLIPVYICQTCFHKPPRVGNASTRRRAKLGKRPRRRVRRRG